MAKKTPISIDGYNIYLVYNQSIAKSNDIKEQESESSTKIYYLYRTDIYTLNVSFKCNSDIGKYIDNAVSNKITMSVTFADVGKYTTKTMIAKSRNYNCITLAGKEFWDMSVSFQEV